MKRNFTFLKTLLVAVGLFMGTSAWADDVIVYEKGTNTNPWTSEDVSTFTVSGATLSYSATAGMTFDAQTANSSFYATKTFSHTANSIVTVDAIWNGYSNTSASYAQGAYFQFGEIFVWQNDQGQDSGYGYYGMGSTSVGTFKHGTYRSGTSPNYHIQFTINTLNNTLTSFSVKSEDDATTWVNVTTPVVLESFDYTTLKFGFNKTTRTLVAKTSSLISIKITETPQPVTNVDYTLNYMLENNSVKTVEGTGAVGAIIKAATAVDGEGDYAGNHYLITEETSPTMTLTNGTNVLNVPVRAPYTATYRLTKIINGNSSYVDYPFTETDAKVCSYAVGWPMYEKSGDDYYLLTGETDYAAIGTFTNGQTITKTINYTTSATDVVWFKDINGGSVTSASYSGGSYANVSEQLANVTVDAGVYDVIFNVVSKAGQGSNHRNEGVSVNGENVANLSGNVNGVRTLRIIVENDNSTITAYGIGASNYTDNLDYVIVRKIMDGITIPATITSSTGYATFSSTCALDFTGITTLTAYKATSCDGTSVTLEPITGTVAANTGLVIKGETTNIPVVVSGDEATGNMLFALDGSYSELGAGTGGTNYVLTVQDVEPVFAPIGATPAPVTAGHAALFVPNGSARTLNIVFGDETNGVEAIESNVVKTNNYYNLNGQRVVKPAKGLYIVNGKKVIVK